MGANNQRNKRIRMFIEQDSKCYYCGEPMLLPVKGQKTQYPNSATIEHLHPQSMGGKGLKDVVCACRYCNVRRATFPAQEFKRIRNIGPHWKKVYAAARAVYYNNQHGNQNNMVILLRNYRAIAYV